MGTMKVNDGYWLIRDGWRVLHPVDVLDVATTADSVTVIALTRRFTVTESAVVATSRTSTGCRTRQPSRISQ